MKWTINVTQRAIQRFSKKIARVLAVESVRHHPVICIAYGPPEMCHALHLREAQTNVLVPPY